MDARSKEKVLSDAEEIRTKAQVALQTAGAIWSGQNSVASGWRAVKWAGLQTKDRAVIKARQVDYRIRSNVYTSLGIAFGVGLIAGLLSHRRRKNIP